MLSSLIIDLLRFYINRLIKSVNDSIAKSDAKLLQRSEEAAAESAREIVKTNKLVYDMLAIEKAKEMALERAAAGQK